MQGTWVAQPSGWEPGRGDAVCPVCAHYLIGQRPGTCPQCGARMHWVAPLWWCSLHAAAFRRFAGLGVLLVGAASLDAYLMCLAQESLWPGFCAGITALVSAVAYFGAGAYLMNRWYRRRFARYFGRRPKRRTFWRTWFRFHRRLTGTTPGAGKHRGPDDAPPEAGRPAPGTRRNAPTARRASTSVPVRAVTPPAPDADRRRPSE